MRRLVLVGLLLAVAGCAAPEPSGKRYVVFFRSSSAETADPADAVLANAAAWAVKHPEMPVVVASYADPYGTPQVNQQFVRMRAQMVVGELTKGGVAPARIQTKEMGPVKFVGDALESRRVEITVGSP